MATHCFKEPNATEGACGKIVDTEDPGIVTKKIHRHLKHKAKGHDATRQCELQQWASSQLTPANGFSILFTPKALSPAKHEYKMERIDCSDQVDSRST